MLERRGGGVRHRGGRRRGLLQPDARHDDAPEGVVWIACVAEPHGGRVRLGRRRHDEPDLLPPGERAGEEIEVLREQLVDKGLIA